MKNKKNGNFNTQIERYFAIEIWASLEMQKFIKPRCPSRQLLETVNFAFMKIFDSLVKIAVFRASLLFLGDSRHAFPPWSRRAILTKKLKNLIKAKLTVSKSCLLGVFGFLIFCILRGDLLKITKYLCNLSVTMTIFLTFHNRFMMLVHMEVHSKYHLLMMD